MSADNNCIDCILYIFIMTYEQIQFICYLFIEFLEC